MVQTKAVGAVLRIGGVINDGLATAAAVGAPCHPQYSRDRRCSLSEIQYGQVWLTGTRPQPLVWAFGTIAVVIVTLRAVAKRDTGKDADRRWKCLARLC